MQSVVQKVARTQRQPTTVRSSGKASAIPANIHAAAQLLYFAVMDPMCKEVREALDDFKILDHANKTLDLETFHKHLIHALPVATMVKGGKRHGKRGGGMDLKKCILLGLLVLLLTIASYIISVRSEMSIYQAKCANVMTLFDPKRSSVGTFFQELNKFAQMVFNKEHIDYCKSMEDKYGSLGMYLARELNKTMGSLKARMTASFAVVTAIASILNGGVHALICIASKWMGELDTICGEACSRKEKATKKEAYATPKKKSPVKEEESDEESDGEEDD